MVYLLRRRDGLTREAFHDYWLNHHGPLVAGAATHLGLLRHVQVHTVEDDMNEAMAKARGGMESIYDGVAEYWWENEAALMAALGTEEGRTAIQLLLADERAFIDLPASPLWLAREYPQVNPTPENIVASVKSSILKLHFPLRHLEGRDPDEVRGYWLQNHGPIIRSHAPASGILRYV